MLFRRSLRHRITFQYVATTAVLFLIYSLLLYGLFRHQVMSDFERKIRSDFEIAELELERLVQLSKASGVSPDFIDFRLNIFDPNNFATEIWSTSKVRVFSSADQSQFFLGELSDSCAGSLVNIGSLPNNSTHSGAGVLCSPSEAYPGDYVIRVARLTSLMDSQMSNFLNLILISGPIILLLIAAVGFVLARRNLAPISTLTAKANDISADNLNERLSVNNPRDELGELASAFNRLFDRISRSFLEMKRFTGDASHELRTPLASIRTIGEVCIREGRSPQQYHDTILNILEETARLQNLCESLLSLSRAESDDSKLNCRTINIKKFILDTIDVVSVLAEDKNQRIEIEISDHIEANFDEELFSQVVLNLVDNAIKFSPANSKIYIQADSTGGRVRIRVLDEGPGIAKEHLPFIFDRFYRVDHGRNRQTGGAGLGLAIAKSIVERHGAKLFVDVGLLKGTQFIIEFRSAINGAIPTVFSKGPVL